jgi:hypothetical protein
MFIISAEDEWRFSFPNCAKTAQSPIDFAGEEILAPSWFSRIDSAYETPDNLQFVNNVRNGMFLYFRLEESMKKKNSNLKLIISLIVGILNGQIQGGFSGADLGRYTLAGFHFHWALGTSKGML